jgi:hypothetical protein
MKNKKYIGILALVLILLTCCIGITRYISKKYDQEHSFGIVNLNNDLSNNLIFPKIEKTPFVLEKDFPTKRFLDSVQYTSFSEIKFVLNWMDSINQNKSRNQQFLASILTDSLNNKIHDSFNSFNADSLNSILIWAEKMKVLSETDADYQMFFEVVSSYWMNFVSNNLSKLSEDNSSIKYKFKYKYLVSRCAQNLNQPNIKVSSTEKIINYTIEGRWGYLWDRFYNGTSIIPKILLFTLGFLTLFSFYCLFLFIRKKI